VPGPRRGLAALDTPRGPVDSRRPTLPALLRSLRSHAARAWIGRSRRAGRRAGLTAARAPSREPAAALPAVVVAAVVTGAQGAEIVERGVGEMGRHGVADGGEDRVGAPGRRPLPLRSAMSSRWCPSATFVMPCSAAKRWRIPRRSREHSPHMVFPSRTTRFTLLQVSRSRIRSRGAPAGALVAVRVMLCWRRSVRAQEGFRNRSRTSNPSPPSLARAASLTRPETTSTRRSKPCS